MGKTLLFIGAGLETVHGIRHAQRRGLKVVATDLNPDAPGLEAADAQLIASTYDIDGTVAAVKQYVKAKGPVHGVISIGVDVPRTVAAVAEALGLPGISTASAALSADKLAMKERFARDGVPIPWFAPVETAAELARLAQKKPGTLVVKPVDSRGSRGVQRLTPKMDAVAVFEHAKEQSPTGRVMVEAYLDGPQISTESLVLKGTAHTPGFSDRNYPYLEQYAPFFIENGGQLPSHLAPRARDAVRALVTQAAASLGVKNGPIKGDIVLHRGKPHVIEMATRLSGGFFCTLEIPLNTGVDFVGAVIGWALGETVEPSALAPRHQKPVVQRYAFLPPGRILAIPGLAAARALPGVEEIVIYAKPGDIIRVPTDTTARAAMAIATGASVKEAEARALAALDALGIAQDRDDAPMRARG